MVDLKALGAPFPPEQISWRVGPTTGDKKSGIGLAYIDARDVMGRLDAVCGPEGWQDACPHAGQKTVYSIGIKIGDEWIYKTDGAGDSDMEAEKGALSDAFKRAAVKWGIGRYLYDFPNMWVPIKPQGKSFVITDEGKKTLIDALRRFSGAAPVATGTAGAGGEFRPAGRRDSSAHGREIAATEPHLATDRPKGTLTKAADAADEGAIKRIEWVKKSIGALRTMNAPAARLWWKAEADIGRIGVIETKLPTEYEKLLDAYNQALGRQVELA